MKYCVLLILSLIVGCQGQRKSEIIMTINDSEKYFHFSLQNNNKNSISCLTYKKNPDFQIKVDGTSYIIAEREDVIASGLLVIPESITIKSESEQLFKLPKNTEFISEKGTRKKLADIIKKEIFLYLVIGDLTQLVEVDTKIN